MIGILGALGKMNWTSSNLLRRRQFSARNILRSISTYAYKRYRDAYHPAPLSPSPWATMTVAVCRFKAGTIKGLAMAICKLSKLSNRCRRKRM